MHKMEGLCPHEAPLRRTYTPLCRLCGPHCGPRHPNLANMSRLWRIPTTILGAADKKEAIASSSKAIASGISMERGLQKKPVERTADSLGPLSESKTDTIVL